MVVGLVVLVAIFVLRIFLVILLVVDLSKPVGGDHFVVVGVTVSVDIFDVIVNFVVVCNARFTFAPTMLEI